MPTIAIIEDDESLNNHLKSLVSTIADAAISQYFNRLSAEEAILENDFDLVILDIELGQGPKDKYGGISILSRLTEKRTVTVVVSGTSEESLPSIVITLRAYDFISKPIDEISFINKIEHALLSSKDPVLPNQASQFIKQWPVGLSPDPDSNPGFLWKGQKVRLTLTHTRIINCLINPPGQTVVYAKLAKQLDSSNAPSAIATHMTGIRQRFTDIDPTFNAIIPDPGKGYVWSI
jgi:DNA-binding response OmpR family regulator